MDDATNCDSVGPSNHIYMYATLSILMHINLVIASLVDNHLCQEGYVIVSVSGEIT